jgi:predicted phosphate transport protein (TIGR00153 family)
MSFSLFPKSPKFFDLFREQNRIIVEAMGLLHAMAQEFEKMDVRGQMINRLESEGDVLNREISQQLSTTFITPIDREDIHQINVSQETILNHIQAISNRICVYGLTRMRFPAQRMISNLKDMVQGIGAMVGMLDRKADVNETVKRLKFLKKECEMLLLSGLGELYDNPDPSPAEVMDIIKWTHVYDRIDKAFNRTWQLAKAIEGIVLKNA